MSAALKLFDQLGITYYAPNKQRSRERLATCCDRFVGRVIEKHGLRHATLALSAISKSKGAGGLISDIIGAVSDVILSHPRWQKLGGQQFVESFRQIDLVEIRKTAKAANVQPLRVGVATLLAIELAKKIGRAHV